MISIQSSLTELERSHQIRAAVLDCYVLAIKNIAHYAVELDEELTGPHRKYLETLATEVATGTSEAVSDSRATLRGLLRDYRDKASQYLANLRDELAGTARALKRSWIPWLKPMAITKRTSTPRLASCARWPPPRVMRHWAP